MLLLFCLAGCNIKSEDNKCLYNDMYWGTSRENVIKEKGEPISYDADNNMQYYENFMDKFFYVSYCFDEKDKLNKIIVDTETSMEYSEIRNMLTEKYGEPSNEMLGDTDDDVKIADWFVGNTYINIFDFGGECDVWYSLYETDRYSNSGISSVAKEKAIVTTIQTTTVETTTETTTLPYLEIGNTGVVSKSQITLNNVGYDTVLYDDSGYYRMTAKDNCQYVLTYITIKNVGNEGISFRWIDNDFYCQLHTSDGLEYSPTTFFPWLDDSLENMSLNPLEEKSGFVAFSVPDEVINSDRDLFLVCSGYPDEIKFKVK